jgi:hypothetical protein
MAAIRRQGKDALRSMNAAQLDAHIRALRQELAWRPRNSFAYKDVAKRLEVAEKLREQQQAKDAAAGDA